MLHALKLFHCPACNHCFTNRDGARYHSMSRFPIVLNCRHTICETCLKNSLKLQQKIVCSICQECSQFENGDTSKLLPDIYALGVATASNVKQTLPSLKMHLSPNSNSTLPNGGLHSAKESRVLCDECSVTEAVFLCDTCQENFCNGCFSRFHKSRGKRFRNHVAVPIYAHSYSKDVQKGCEEHGGRAIEFYCEDDKALICSLCVVKGSHHGHAVNTLVDKNKACAEDLKRMKEDALLVRKRLKATEQKLSQAAPREKIDNFKFITEIHEHFHHLHTALMMRENELIMQVENISTAGVSHIEKLQEEVSHMYRDLDAVLRDAELVLENPALSISIPSIMKKLESTKEFPCHLVDLQSPPEDQTIDVSFDAELEALLLKHGKLSAEVKPKYCLKPTSELPDNYVIEPAVAESIADDESVASDTFSEDSLCVSPLVNAPRVPVPLEFSYQTLKQERVTVTYICDPTNFYIIPCSEAENLAILSDKMTRWCNITNPSKPESLVEGRLYLVRFTGDNKWYRGLVKKVENNDNDSQGLLDKAEIRAKVFYIDFGNEEIVSISRFRNIQKKFLISPGFAKHCSLHNIVPINQQSWTSKAIKDFNEFVKDKEVSLQMMEDRAGMWYVDLLQTPSTDVINDSPVSVRDALVFLEHGCFIDKMATQKGQHSRNTRQFLPPEAIRSNSKITVLVSHVDNPSQFYVQHLRTSRFLTDLLIEMKRVYSEDTGGLHAVYVPYVGMLCAAQYLKDDFWYRAEIVSVTSSAHVEVQYVDFGNRAILHYKKLRKLLNQFSKLNVQAIPCSLADVTYLDGKGWPQESSDWLTLYLEKKHLILLSLGMVTGSRITKTVLFESQDVEEVCINALMVAKGKAHSTGSHSVEVLIPKKPPPAPVKKVPKVDNPPAPVEQPALPTKEVAVESLVAKNVPPNCVEVHMSHIESPGMFFVRLSNEIEENFTRLMDDLQKVYKEISETPDEVELGSSYACLRASDEKWYRGIISEIYPDENYQVRFVDIGCAETMKKDNLRDLLEQHKNDQAYAIRCHLVRVNPAGDSNKWPHIAVSTFQDLVAPHKVLYLTADAIAEDGSCPCDIFFKELIFGGALEPSKIEFMSIRDKLVEKGVALKARNPISSPKFKPLPVPANESTSRSTPTSKSSSEEGTPNPSPKHPNFVKKSHPRLPTFQWLPAEIPVADEFLCRATHVGDDGCIYVQMKPEGVSKVDVITNALACKYALPVGDKLRIPPAIGEAVIAKFPMDEKWYRAEIVSDNPDRVKVQFVDFGNYEIVELEDIRLDVPMKEIPRLAVECSLHDTRPTCGQTWQMNVLDFMHQTIVDQDCSVKVVAPREEGKTLQVSITLQGAGMAVPKLLKEMKFAVSEEQYLNRIEAAQKSSNLGYPNANDLNYDVPFRICVTHVLEPNVVCVQRLKFDNPCTEKEITSNKEIDDFLKLVEDLNSEAESFVDVTSPQKGMACCARYTFDNQWYRCEIIDISPKGIQVLYSDYGNTETLPTDYVLKLPTEKFLEFPIQVHNCKIRGLQPINDNWPEECRQALMEKYTSRAIKLYASIENALNDDTELDLLIKNKSGEFEQFHNDLIEKGLLK